MWTVLGVVLLLFVVLFLGDAILAFAAEQLRECRTHRLQLECEHTKQALLAHDRDTEIWRGRKLENAISNDHAQEMN
jgi:hypothetical protein